MQEGNCLGNTKYYVVKMIKYLVLKSCYPCTIVVDIKCTCGLSKIKVPCVKSKTNITVTCKNPCKYVFVNQS